MTTLIYFLIGVFVGAMAMLFTVSLLQSGRAAPPADWTLEPRPEKTLVEQVSRLDRTVED